MRYKEKHTHLLSTLRSFKGVLQLATAGLAMLVLAVPSAMADEANYEHLSSASAPYVPTRIVDSDSMPIEGPQGAIGIGRKTLFKNPTGEEHLTILHIPPGWEGGLNHYHEFHEWAWMIAGDLTNNESTHPDQVSGPLQRFVEGDFLSRPPYSLHGGEGAGRQPFMASQVGAAILIMEEGNVRDETWRVDPTCRDGTPCPGYNDGHLSPVWEEITHWAIPRIIDTINEMPWQPVESSPGLNIKHLVDDPSHGFRATMWFLEAGAKTPDFMRAQYYKKAHQFNWMIAGDLKIQAYRDPDHPAETYTILKHYLVDRSPMSILGVVDENATEGGAVWLEVTYAKGTAWTDELARIEEPNYVK